MSDIREFILEGGWGFGIPDYDLFEVKEDKRLNSIDGGPGRKRKWIVRGLMQKFPKEVFVCKVHRTPDQTVYTFKRRNQK